MMIANSQVIHKKTGSVVSLSAAREARQLTVDQAFERWTALKEKAWRTGDKRDAIASGRAYADFVELFVRHG